MGTLAKINGIAVASIAKVNGIAIAGIAKVNGHDWPAGGPSYAYEEDWSTMTETTQYTDGAVGGVSNSHTITGGLADTRYFYKPSGVGPYFVNNGNESFYWDATTLACDASNPWIYLKFKTGASWQNNDWCTFYLRDGTTGALEYRIFRTDGLIYVYLYGQGLVDTITAGADTVLGFNFNFSAHTFDVYLNGTLQYNDIAMGETIDGIDNLRFFPIMGGSVANRGFYPIYLHTQAEAEA